MVIFSIQEAAVDITLKAGSGIFFDGESRCGAATLCCQESKVRLRPPSFSSCFVLIQEIRLATFLFQLVKET